MKSKLLFIISLICSTLLSLAYSSDDYVIGIDDALQIEVYQEPDLSVSVHISSDGCITYPLLGKVKVEGLSVSQIQQTLMERLAKDYLVDPQVTVNVTEYGNIYVLGEVKSPGRYKMSSRMTVLQATTLGGGLTELADRSSVIVTRTMGSKKKTFTIDLSDDTEASLEAKDMDLKPNDTVLVKKLSNINILGEVNRPGQFPLKEELTVVDAITLAGGFTKIAAPNRTRVIRTEGGVKKVIVVPVDSILKSGDRKKDVVLKANDVIIVPESFL